MGIGQTITELRKKNGWSQENLAHELNVSRQSVSKWESEQSVPELEKIVKMSELFGVSTDYILKGAAESQISGSESVTGDDASTKLNIETRSMSAEEVETAIEVHKRAAKGLALGVSLCILSAICVVLLAGYIDYMKIQEEWIFVGVAALLVTVAIGLAFIIPNSIKLGKYDYLEEENIILDKRTSDAIRHRRDEYSPTFMRGIVFGVVLCVLGVIPVLIGPMLGENALLLCSMISLLLLAVSVAVHVFIRVCTVNDLYQELLQEGDYTVKKKEVGKRIEPFATAYWCIITATYLAISFLNNNWDRSWIIWPVAAVAFGAIKGIMLLFESRKR